jgi:hypothetical protein
MGRTTTFPEERESFDAAFEARSSGDTPLEAALNVKTCSPLM